MIEITLIEAASAFLAGILMFLAPCTLPLLPAYLAFISGTSQSAVATQSHSRCARLKIITNALAFIVGFSFVFIGFGILAGLFGGFFSDAQIWIARVGGAFIIIFGFLMLGLVKITPLLIERRFSLPKSVKPGHPTSAFLIGIIFAAGWTPCVGPVLASMLFMASTLETVWGGALLLTIFSAGLAVPLLCTAILYSRATAVISRFGYLTKSINIVGGIFLILVGVLLLTDSFGVLVEYGYQVFYWLGFEQLFDYL